MFDDAFRATLTELFRWRRDVRRFTSDALPQGTLEQLVQFAHYAPSVGYSEPWRFVRVSSPERRAFIAEAFQRANADALATYDGERAATYASLKLAGLREAPEHLAVFSDADPDRGSGLGRATMPEMLDYSVVCAIHTLWLAARARGIGVGWVSIIDPAAVTRALETPPSWHLVAYLCIGYPQEEHVDRELARANWEPDSGADVVLLER